MPSLEHVVKLFRNNGVQVAFSGHEHNFQFAGRNTETGQTLYVVSGAGGQVRTGSFYGEMAAANIEGTVAQRHFVVVEIEGDTLFIHWLDVTTTDTEEASRIFVEPFEEHLEKTFG